MKHLMSLGFTLIFVSCATTMPGSEVSTGNNKVSATVTQNPNFSNQRIQMHQVSLRNETDNWIELEGATLDANKSTSVLVGAHITSWIDACTLEKNVSDYNTALVLGSLAVAGSAVAVSSNHPQTSGIGAIAALGSIGAVGVRDYQTSKDRVTFQNAFPDKHIFQALVIPPRKVIQRWILVENPFQEAFTLRMKGKDEEVVITVKKEKPTTYSDKKKQSNRGF